MGLTSAEIQAELLAFSDVGDPPADALVRALKAERRGLRLLDAALDGRAPRGAPAELEAFLEPLREPPVGLDAGLAEAGAVATWVAGSFPQFLALTYGSLAFGYRSARLSRPLAATGRLEVMAGRRLAETSRWFVAATTPGALRVGEAGWRETVRVRVVHALLRDHLSRSAAWDPAWGLPINAADGFATAIGGFYVVPMRALRDLGVRFTPAEREAVAHLWTTIAWLMGVPDALLPDGSRDAVARVDAALGIDPGPDESGPRLMAALLRHGLPVPGFATPVSRQLAGGLIRRWMDGEMADHLGVPRAPVGPLVDGLRLSLRARGAARAAGALGDDRDIAARELTFVHRTLAVTRAPSRPLAPEQATALAA